MEKLTKEYDKLRESVDTDEKGTDENGSAENGSENVTGDKFPSFEGKDLDGNKVDSGIFAKNKFAVVNFWYNECAPCVKELPLLNKINEYAKTKGGEVIGINQGTVESWGKGDDTIKEAKAILKKLGVTYRNVYFSPETEAGKYVKKLIAFPTTVIVDAKGQIVGDPVPALNSDKDVEALKARIDKLTGR